LEEGYIPPGEDGELASLAANFDAVSLTSLVTIRYFPGTMPGSFGGGGAAHSEEFKDSHLHEKPSCARPPLSDPRNRNWSEEEFTDFFKAEEEKESKRKSHLRRIREVANMSASQSGRAFKGSSFSSFKQSIMNFFVE